MISRYAFYDTPELSNYFKIAAGSPKGVKPSYNISPAVNAPVILSHEGVPTIKLMKWGLLPVGSKDTNSIFRYKTYNLASEKIYYRHSWEQAISERRCLVPANGFYELNGSGKKQAYYAKPKDGSILAFAGVYNTWEDPDGIVQGTYSIVTIDANSDLQSPDGRMPVIIKAEDQARWLDTSVKDLSSLYDMLRAYPSGQLEEYEVSPAVHSPKPNQADLIERL